MFNLRGLKKVEIEFGLLAIAPVSYTHLVSALEGIPYSYVISFHDSFHLIVDTRFIARKDYRIFNLAPVSYTHLDVYKRQVRGMVIVE